MPRGDTTAVAAAAAAVAGPIRGRSAAAEVAKRSDGASLVDDDSVALGAVSVGDEEDEEVDWGSAFHHTDTARRCDDDDDDDEGMGAALRGSISSDKEIVLLLSPLLPLLLLWLWL